MPFKIVRNDITKMKVDAIVNPANQLPIYSRGTDMAVYLAAGAEQLLKAREKIGVLEECEVAITPGFQLPSKYIIHAASPKYIDGKHNESERLKECYLNCMNIALNSGCESIAFPLVSTGNFAFPKAEGLEIALNAIHSFLLKKDMMIYLVVFDNEAYKLSGQLFEDIEAYIDDKYVEQKHEIEYVFDSIVSVVKENAAKEYGLQHIGKSDRSLEDIIMNIGETFQQRLFRLIDERDLKDSDVYKRAGKDKKFFHKIRCNVNYQPTKHTVFAFAIALELSLDELKDLLKCAGFAISPSSRFDLIMQYIFEHEIYDIYKIDCILYDLGETHYFGCEH